MLHTVSYIIVNCVSVDCFFFEQIMAARSPISILIIDDNFSFWFIGPNALVGEHVGQALPKVIDRMEFWKSTQPSRNYAEISVDVFV